MGLALNHPSIYKYSTGGNLLMDVGPTNDGRVMPIFQERLLLMGKLFPCRYK